MAKKRYSYNALTTKRFREMGWYYEKAEYLNPFHIIKERDDLRKFRDKVIKFCELIKNLIKHGVESSLLLEHIINLQNTAVDIRNNKYFPGQKKDMFGFMDYICIDPFRGAVAVQSTSASGHAEHRRKILRNDYAARWAGFHPIELLSWRKSPKIRGQKTKIWKPKIEIITLEMFK